MLIMGSAVRRVFTLLAIALVFGESYQREIEDANLQGLAGSSDAELMQQSNDFAIHLYKVSRQW